MDKEVEDNEKYWWSEKPTATATVVVMIIFPFIGLWWLIATISKKIMVKHSNRRFLKIMGRPKNNIEDLLYKMNLDRSFMI